MSNGCCKLHGGKTPRGAASPHFKTGEHSKEFLARFRHRAETFLKDRDGRELARAIAYATTLVEETVDKLDSHESGAAWLAAQDAIKRFDEWSAKSPEDASGKQQQLIEINRALQDLKRAITQGVAEHHSREELKKNLDLQTKLIERETNGKVKTRMMIAYEEQVAMLNRTYDLISKYVEPSKRGDLLNELSAMVAVEPQRSLATGH